MLNEQESEHIINELEKIKRKVNNLYGDINTIGHNNFGFNPNHGRIASAGYDTRIIDQEITQLINYVKKISKK